MNLFELFANPIKPKLSDRSSPGNNHYEFQVDTRRYEVVIKTRYAENDKIYIIDFAYLGDDKGDTDYHTRMDDTGFRTDSYKVLGAVIHIVREFFAGGKMGYYDTIHIEPNTGAKEKLYKIFTQKLAADLGMKWRYFDTMWYEISGSFEEE